MKRGYRRLAIVVIGSWLAVWGFIGGYAVWQQGFWSRLYIEASQAGRMGEAVYANDQGEWFGRLVALSLVGGVTSVPIALAFAMGWWVYRGFRPNGSR